MYIQKTIRDIHFLFSLVQESKNLEEFLLCCTIKEKDTQYFFAVSGGVDSMVLATVYIYALEFHGVSRDHIYILHYHHAQREEADQEKNDVYIYFEGYTILSDKYEGLLGATEQVLRKARRLFFEKCMQGYTNPCLFLGHHLQDAIETMMLNIQRGCGIRGLGALPQQQYHKKYDGRMYTIYRPFRSYLKQEIYAIADLYTILYREDTTNQQAEYSQRNLVRKEYLAVESSAWKNAFHLILGPGDLPYWYDYITLLPCFATITFAACVSKEYIQTESDVSALLDYCDIYTHCSYQRLQEIMHVCLISESSFRYGAGRYIWNHKNTLYILKGPQDFWKQPLDFYHKDTTIEISGIDYDIPSDVLYDTVRPPHIGDIYKGKSLAAYLNTRAVPVFLKPFCCVFLLHGRIQKVLTPSFLPCIYCIFFGYFCVVI